MPRTRQRIVVCDCFDCVEQNLAPTHALLSAANEAAAKQDPPPKCIIFLCSGFIASNGMDLQSNSLDHTSVPHIDRVAQNGSQGFITSRKGACKGSVGEVAQLLGVHEELSQSENLSILNEGSLPSLSSRFKGMQAALSSNVDGVCQLGKACGLRVSKVWHQSSDEGSDPTAWLPDPLRAVQQMLRELGIPADEIGSGTKSSTSEAAKSAQSPSPSQTITSSSGQTLSQNPGQISGQTFSQTPGLADGQSSSQTPGQPSGQASGQTAGQTAGQTTHHNLPDHAEELDMLIVHVGLDAEDQTTSGSSNLESVWEKACRGLEWVDACLRHLNQASAVRDTVLLCLLLSSSGRPYIKPLEPGGALLHPGTAIMSVTDQGATDSAFQVKRPVQSFETKAGKPADVALDAPLIAVRRLPGVIRNDRGQKLSVEECVQRSGVGVVLLDHVLPEIAYKVGRAPKYGA